MGLNAEAYARQLKALLPTGPAWTGTDKMGVFGRLLLAIGDELARIDARCDDLIRELDPATTTELLPDWERVLGLPDPCLTQAQTLQQRRAAVVTKYTLLGGQNAQFYIDLAASIGFPITITEFDPFVAGSDAGDPLSNDEGGWPYTWQVNAPEETIQYFRSGQNTSGDALRTWGNEQLECAINARKPAHTNLLFAYGA